jgi:hypothetical protein
MKRYKFYLILEHNHPNLEDIILKPSSDTPSYKLSELQHRSHVTLHGPIGPHSSEVFEDDSKLKIRCSLPNHFLTSISQYQPSRWRLFSEISIATSYGDQQHVPSIYQLTTRIIE